MQGSAVQTQIVYGTELCGVTHGRKCPQTLQESPPVDTFRRTKAENSVGEIHIAFIPFPTPLLHRLRQTISVTRRNDLSWAHRPRAWYPSSLSIFKRSILDFKICLRYVESSRNRIYTNNLKLSNINGM